MRSVAARDEVLKLRRPGGDVIDDQVGHDVGTRGQRAYVGPVAEARVDARVVDGVEARVGAVDRVEER